MRPFVPSDRVKAELDSALEGYEGREDEDALLSRLSKRFQKDGLIADKDDFLEVVKRKAARSLGHARKNPVATIRERTRRAFDLALRDEIVQAPDLLGILKGVKTRTATTLLTFYDPARFTVMDVNV